MAVSLLDDQNLDVQHLQDTVIEALSDGVYFVDRQRRILYWNSTAERLTGYRAESVIGRCCHDNLLKHVNEEGRCLCHDGCPLAATMQDGVTRQAHVFLHHAEGHRVPVHVRAAPIRDRNGEIIGCVEVFSDDTDRVASLERLARLEQEAMLDELTGIANRRLFQRSLDASLSDFERHGVGFALMLIDIDHFKHFNDRFGHDVGDGVLRLVAKTLAHSCRASDTPARWGGEEFIVLLNHTALEQIAAAGERFRSLISATAYKHRGIDLSVNVSIGACVVRRDDTAETLIKRTDELLYHSKRAGRDCVTVG